MALTPQAYALDQAKKRFGRTAFTIHHLHYVLVGCEREGKRVFCLGDSWEEVFAALERKAR